MTRFVIYRVVSVIPTLFGISLAVFFMVRAVPGDPIDIMYANRAKPTPEQRAIIERNMGLDLPVHRQYVRYMSRILLHGDLGTSYRTKRPVTEQIRTRLPNTVKLAVASMVVALGTGLAAGVISAVLRGTFIDRAIMFLAVGGVSIPLFWLGLMFILVFSVRLGWLPVAGARSWKHLVMPALTLGLGVSAVLARITRSAVLEALEQDYVRTARAKGLRESAIVYRHVLRNALIPVVTIIGLIVGGLLSGAFLVEAVFGYPGIGLLGVNALTARDFPLIQGIVLFVAVVYVLTNVAVDIVYGIIDPRIQLG